MEAENFSPSPARLSFGSAPLTPLPVHLAELGAQPLGLGRVRPGKADPELLDVAEAQAGSGCRAAVFGGGIHRLQLERQEGSIKEAWDKSRPSPGINFVAGLHNLSEYSLCPHPQLPEGATWPGHAGPVARASQLAGMGCGCQQELGSGYPCSGSCQSSSQLRHPDPAGLRGT
jgi:hypothetical protein